MKVGTSANREQNLNVEMSVDRTTVGNKATRLLTQLCWGDRAKMDLSRPGANLGGADDETVD